MTIPVIYIISASRSGSTALDLALGQFVGSESLGELRNLARFGIQDKGLCGCGDPVVECSFWNQVLTSGEPILADVFENPEAYVRAQSQSARMRFFRKVLRDKPLPVDSEVVDRHRSYLAALFRGLARTLPNTVLIDSSKSPIGAAELMRDDSVSALFVHLVRDPRAVAFSTSKGTVQQADVTGRLMARSSVERAAAIWDLTNAQARSVGKAALAGRYIVVRYEDLTADPSAELGRIWHAAKHAGLIAEIPPLGRPGPNHTAWGNPMRLQSRSVVWTHDDRWVEGMDRRSRLAVSALTLIPRLRFGYGRKLSSRL